MALVSVNELNVYCNNYEDSQDVVAMKEVMLESAQQVVEDYLGYKLQAGERRGVFSGVGSDRLYLPDYNIISVDKLLITNSKKCCGFLDMFDYGPCYVQERFGVPVFIEGRSNIIIEYYAGWKVDNLPKLIRMTILRIAALMLTESNGNIGLTGRNFADQSKSFMSYANYDKYLRPLEDYRGVRN